MNPDSLGSLYPDPEYGSVRIRQGLRGPKMKKRRFNVLRSRRTLFKRLEVFCSSTVQVFAKKYFTCLLSNCFSTPRTKHSQYKVFQEIEIREKFRNNPASNPTQKERSIQWDLASTVRAIPSRSAEVANSS
jgi:hypothetical protein